RSKTLPPELLREILGFYIAQNTNFNTKDTESSKPSWQLFSSLSLASKILRTLALEAWFRVLLVKHDEDLCDEYLPFTEIKRSWTLEIHFIQWTEDSRSWNVDDFTRLRKIRIDCSKVDVVPPKFPNGSVILHNIEVEIRNIYWPSPLVAQYIVRAFPMLKVLTLRQTRTWCGLCHTCCFSEFQHPIPKLIRYEDGTGLPIHYAQAFASLKNLETVYLMVGVLESGKTRLGSEEGRNPNLWSGECDRCMEIMYEDETFRSDWVAKKKTSTVKPPRLSLVEWCFLSREEFDPSAWNEDEGDIGEE
ncbi:hypothetical protein J3R30DRAFT_3295695, partial [Lentinula aciculospora]